MEAQVLSQFRVAITTVSGCPEYHDLGFLISRSH